ncbi:hypothetical protein HD598_001292 [Neomicrococcus aestuarii]|uniref:Uncharacterized protein n=1 Tax=Neomicrococcus aestuarii TaxID=556325 RepID=A0A7W8TUZ9_9MICC|nr:hypothetical protein [Neomicrococcus aestuarii]
MLPDKGVKRLQRLASVLTDHIRYRHSYRGVVLSRKDAHVVIPRNSMSSR